MHYIVVTLDDRSFRLFLYIQKDSTSFGSVDGFWYLLGSKPPSPPIEPETMAPQTEQPTSETAEPSGKKSLQIKLCSIRNSSSLCTSVFSKWTFGNPKVWRSISHGDSVFFLCPTLVIRRKYISLFLYWAQNLPSSLFFFYKKWHYKHRWF